MAGRIIIDAVYRATPWASLDEIFYWHAELPDAQRWTLMAELRGVLNRYKQGEYLRTEVSQETAEKLGGLEGGHGGHL